MSHPFTPRVGAVMSADIAVPEHDREVAFYARALTTGADPFWREDLMNRQGTPVIGLGARSPEHDPLPLQWMPHVQVKDVAASAARAVELGGTELLHGKDDEGSSQWAVLLDSNGAAFGLIPVVPPGSTPPMDVDVSKVGCIAWLDLTVPDAAATRDFYCQVIGWTSQDVDMTDAGGAYHDYVLLGGDGEPAAGICHARGTNQDVPPVWLVYLPVGDLGESTRRVQEDGGAILARMDGPPAIAIVEDPAGVVLALSQG